VQPIEDDGQRILRGDVEAGVVQLGDQPGVDHDVAGAAAGKNATTARVLQLGQIAMSSGAIASRVATVIEASATTRTVWV